MLLIDKACILNEILGIHMLLHNSSVLLVTFIYYIDTYF